MMEGIDLWVVDCAFEPASTLGEGSQSQPFDFVAKIPNLEQGQPLPVWSVHRTH